jgi:hypothetical protein
MYYCHRISDTEAFLHQVDIAFGDRLTYQTDYREDLKWDDFYDLAYPLPFQLEMIKNRSVVKMLIGGTVPVRGGVAGVEESPDSSEHGGC